MGNGGGLRAVLHKSSLLMHKTITANRESGISPLQHCFVLSVYLTPPTMKKWLFLICKKNKTPMEDVNRK